MKYVYHYHPNSGEYLGSEPADPSPREKGVYLLPAHATFERPNPPNGKAPVFNTGKGKWEYKEDHRGVYYVLHGNRVERVTITKLGEQPPKNSVSEEHYHAVIRERRWRDDELQRTDKFMLPDYPIGFFERLRIRKYRKRLRNWPSSPYFPDPKERPKLS